MKNENFIFISVIIVIALVLAGVTIDEDNDEVCDSW